MSTAVIAAACGRACVTAACVFTVIPSLLGQMVCVCGGGGGLYRLMCACVFEMCIFVHSVTVSFTVFLYMYLCWNDQFVSFCQKPGVLCVELAGFYSLAPEHGSCWNQTCDLSGAGQVAHCTKMNGSQWKTSQQPWGLFLLVCECVWEKTTVAAMLAASAISACVFGRHK